MEALKFIFSNFWIWLGFFMILGMVLYFPFRILNRILRHRNIRKHGYPPYNCDADGDFKKTSKDQL